MRCFIIYGGLFVIFLVCCRTANGRALGTDEINNVEKRAEEIVMEKRQLDSREMALIRYCLTKGEFDLRCRNLVKDPNNSGGVFVIRQK